MGRSSASNRELEPLNGSFAFIVADAEGLSVITDPMNYVQGYMATDGRGNVASIGTHPDLVATVGGQSANLDLNSIGELLNAGTPLFPNTSYTSVKELAPGSVHSLTLA